MDDRARTTDLPDPLAIRRAEQVLALFDDHQTVFEAFDPQFDAAYRAQWRTAIDAAISFPTDESTLDEQKGYLQAIEAQAKLAKQVVADLRYYAQKAFGTKGFYTVFGFGRSARSRFSTANHVVYLHSLHRLAQHYSAQLMAQGMAAGQITALETVANHLLEAEVQQETYKRLRTERAVVRSQTMRHMWGFVQEVNKAALVVFANDPVVQGLFGG